MGQLDVELDVRKRIADRLAFSLPTSWIEKGRLNAVYLQSISESRLMALETAALAEMSHLPASVWLDWTNTCKLLMETRSATSSPAAARAHVQQSLVDSSEYDPDTSSSVHPMTEALNVDSVKETAPMQTMTGLGLSITDGLTLFPQTPATSSSNSFMTSLTSRVNSQGALSPTTTEIASTMKYITEKMPDALRASPHSGLVRTYKYYHSLIAQYEFTGD
jgi:hypothetical protein